MPLTLLVSKRKFTWDHWLNVNKMSIFLSEPMRQSLPTAIWRETNLRLMSVETITLSLNVNVRSLLSRFNWKLKRIFLIMSLTMQGWSWVPTIGENKFFCLFQFECKVFCGLYLPTLCFLHFYCQINDILVGFNFNINRWEVPFYL